ncbi:uncharacterized protein An16g06430 [Aspergillus niger]|uniref:Contig An16c0200, genomic contig n=2 Tax=Aspergillus niger TaxID=5061 RepID=A2R8A3_ASPNC|nr:uncharacterized protein An16g06430 [Aspergillus niger]CAK46977.1 unnamed protein product [Aspergillus niger]
MLKSLLNCPPTAPDSYPYHTVANTNIAETPASSLPSAKASKQASKPLTHPLNSRFPHIPRIKLSRTPIESNSN